MDFLAKGSENAEKLALKLNYLNEADSQFTKNTKYNYLRNMNLSLLTLFTLIIFVGMISFRLLYSLAYIRCILICVTEKEF